MISENSPEKPQFDVEKQVKGITETSLEQQGVVQASTKHSTYSTKIRTQNAKKNMLKALEKTMGVVSLAAQLADIDRGTHYKWLSHDQKYKEAAWYVKEEIIDRLEQAAYRMALIENNPQVLLATLKAKAKSRGWGDGNETSVNVNMPPSHKEPEISFEQFRRMAQKTLEAKYGKPVERKGGLP